MDFPHRTYCDTLTEIRKVLANTNLFNYKKSMSIISVLVEECQVYGNRMEAGLEYARDINSLHKRRAKLRAEVAALKDVVGEDDD